MKPQYDKQRIILFGTLLSLCLAIIAWLYSFFVLNNGTLRDSLITIIPFLIGLSGHSFKGLFSDIKKHKRLSEKQKIIGERLKKYFPDFFPCNLEYFSICEDTDEISILKKSIETNWILLDKYPVNYLVLCYFCKKWAEGDDEQEAFINIQNYSDSIGIKYAKLDKKTQLFFDLYKLSMKLPSNETYHNLLSHFINTYNLESTFYELKNELKETKSFHSTLVELIKYGQLSSYGISKETLKKLDHSLRKEFEAECTYLILTNGIKKTDLEDFIKSLPGFSGRVSTRKLIKYSYFAIWIVQLPDTLTKEEFIKLLRQYSQNGDECIIWISPIDFINSDLITNFETEKFSNKHLQSNYEIIQSLTSKKEYDSALIWNEITKSSITAEELMSIIPFNIFCKDILANEQTYFIKNYSSIKEALNITTLTQWSYIKPASLVNCLISLGYPDYTYDEKLYLDFDLKGSNEELIKKRLKKLSSDIIKGSKKFAFALNQDSEYWDQFS